MLRYHGNMTSKVWWHTIWPRKLGSRMALMPIRKKGPQKIVMNCTHHPYGRESKKLLTTMKEKTPNVCQSGSLHKNEQIIHPQVQALATPNVHFFCRLQTYATNVPKKCSNKHLHVKWTFCGPEILRKLPQNRILLYFHISSQCCLVWGWHGPDYLQ